MNDFLQEILDMHDFLEGWLKGTVSRGDGQPWRLAQGLSDDFVIINPSGSRGGKSDVLRAFAASYGEKPASFGLMVGGIETRLIADGLCLATYEEWHRGEYGRARVSTAFIRRRNQQPAFEWLFLQETPAPHVEPADKKSTAIRQTV